MRSSCDEPAAPVAGATFLRIGRRVYRDSLGLDDLRGRSLAARKARQINAYPLARVLDFDQRMHVVKVIIASLALACSGLCLLDVRSWSEPVQPLQTYRSAEDELRKMQQRPEGALVLWIPGEIDSWSSDISPVELEAPIKSSAKKVARAPAWPRGPTPKLAEAR